MILRVPPTLLSPPSGDFRARVRLKESRTQPGLQGTLADMALLPPRCCLLECQAPLELGFGLTPSFTSHRLCDVGQITVPL